MRQYILTATDEAASVLNIAVALPPGWDITLSSTETLEEANRRRAIAEADLAEVKLQMTGGDVMKSIKPVGPTDVYVHVFGKEYRATVDGVFAQLLLGAIADLSPDDYLDVGRLSERLSPIVPASVLENKLWGTAYAVYVKGNHIAIVRPGIADAWKARNRGY
jgi:hypothetical protein